LNRSVPVADEVTSLSAIGPVAAGHHGPMAFTTTHWSVVVEAQGESPAAQEALEKLCRTYWRPIYSCTLHLEVAAHFFSKIVPERAARKVEVC
jgi:hypothetical protein